MIGPVQSREAPSSREQVTGQALPTPTRQERALHFLPVAASFALRPMACRQRWRVLAHISAVSYVRIREGNRNMPRNPKHEWIKLRCPVCGSVTELTAGRLASHYGPDDAACPGAGHAAEVPRVSTKREYLCPECGQRTYSNLRSGIVHSHNLTGQTDVCRNSGRFLGPIGLVVDAVLVHERAAPQLIPVPKERRPVNYDRPSTSVRTVSGGLPGLGKRN